MLTIFNYVTLFKTPFLL